MKKRILATILSALMILSLAACSGTSTDADNNGGGDNDRDNRSSSQDDPQSDNLPDDLSVVNTRGNTNSNISVIGVVARQGDWIYFSTEDAIYKAKTDGTEKQQIVNRYGYWLNVVGDWIYYRSSDSDTGYAMSLFKARTDGTEEQRLDSSTNNAYVNVVGDWIYYANNEGLYRIRTNGAEREHLYESGNYGCINVEGDWIYFNHNGSVRGAVQAIYKVKTDGTDAQEIHRSGPVKMVVEGDWIYFGNYYGWQKIRTDGTDLQRLDYGSTLIADGWMYFIDSENDNGLHRIKVDGTDRQLIYADTITDGIQGVWDDLLVFSTRSEVITDGDRSLLNIYLYSIKPDGTDKQLLMQSERELQEWQIEYYS